MAFLIVEDYVWTLERCRELHRDSYWRDFKTHQFCIICLVLIFENADGQLPLFPNAAPAAPSKVE